MKKRVTFLLIVCGILTFAVLYSHAKPDPALRPLDEFREGLESRTLTNDAFDAALEDLVAKAPEFPDEALISGFLEPAENMDAETGRFYRQIMLELYLTKYDFTISDPIFLDIMQSAELSGGTKTLILNCLDDTLFSSPALYDILVEWSCSSEPELAYHGIKRLAELDMPRAVELSYDILKNMDSEGEARINIALNILAMNYPDIDMSIIDDSGNLSYIEYLRKLYETSTSQEVQISALYSLELVGTPEAAALRESLLASFLTGR